MAGFEPMFAGDLDDALPSLASAGGGGRAATPSGLSGSERAPTPGRATTPGRAVTPVRTLTPRLRFARTQSAAATPPTGERPRSRRKGRRWDGEKMIDAADERVRRAIARAAAGEGAGEEDDDDDPALAAHGPEWRSSFEELVGDDKGCPHGCLFDLATDEGEHHDLRLAHPERFATMLDRLGAWGVTVFQTGYDDGVADGALPLWQTVARAAFASP